MHAAEPTLLGPTHFETLLRTAYAPTRSRTRSSNCCALAPASAGPYFSRTAPTTPTACASDELCLHEQIPDSESRNATERISPKGGNRKGDWAMGKTTAELDKGKNTFNLPEPKSKP